MRDPRGKDVRSERGPVGVGYDRQIGHVGQEQVKMTSLMREDPVMR